MTETPYPIFDADNHYYEAIDAFTRHMDPALAARGVQWAQVGGRDYHIVGGRFSRAVTNPTFNPIAKPGALYSYLRGEGDGRSALDLLRDREPIRPEYLNRDARVEVMEQQGVESIWLFPTLGVLYEELLKEDIPALNATIQAFNRWLDEDWGFAYQNKIFAAPYLSLACRDSAIEELEWVLSRGARLICLRPAAIQTATGPRSPSDEYFDPFWARVAEAGVTTVIHAGDSGYSYQGYVSSSFSADFSGGGGDKPSVRVWGFERAAQDFLATLIFDRLFERFPGLKVASVENGSDFLPDLFRKMKSVGKKSKGYFQNDPADTFRQHVWINPFWEDDLEEIVTYMGPERVLFGSDWPHIEGLVAPLDYLEEVKILDAKAQRLIMYENARSLTESAA
ncbi:MAG: amidohydrolase [Spirochaeta sp.]|nr:amidohydrolase [Spirochaeta sp.]RPG07680.1 MAG: amidohydrolase [Proteobacteria bacterium TMED72]